MEDIAFMISFRRFRVINLFIFVFSIMIFVLIPFMFVWIRFSFDYYINVLQRILIIYFIYFIPTFVIFMLNIFYFSNKIILTNETISVKRFKKISSFKWQDITNYNLGFITCLSFGKTNIVFSTDKDIIKFICNRLHDKNISIVNNRKIKLISVSIIIIAIFSFAIYYFSSDDDNINNYYHWNDSINNITNLEYEENILLGKSITGQMNIFPNYVLNNVDYYNCFVEVVGKEDYIIQETYLKYTFDTKNNFDSEIYRISSIKNYNSNNSNTNEILYFSDMFIYPSYISVYNYNTCYEYALIDSDNLTIYYIRIDHNNNFYIFNEELRPKNKLINYSSYFRYSIYQK